VDAPFASLRAGLAPLAESAGAAEFNVLLDSSLTQTGDRLEPAQWGVRLGGAFETWARGLATDRLLVVELDDLHWMDAATLDVVTRLLGAADLACLLLVTSRPEIDARFPELFAGLPSERIDLRPLSPKAAERLARSLLPASEGLFVHDVVERASGNPFFLRELARVAHAQGNADALPTSLAFVIQRRIDALPTTAREVCRVAATFGDRSWVEALEFVLGRTCAADVLALQQAGILRIVAPSIEACTELAFRHALFRESAAGMTVEADARSYHSRILEWLKPRSHQVELLAHHAERTGLAGVAAD
jgi:predicted ATPase